MADFMVKLPSNFRYVYQFDNSSQFKCVEAVLAMAGQIAYPSRYPNPHQLMDQIYTKYVGPDVPGDRNGTTPEEAKAWLTSQGIGFIDMQPLIDSGETAKIHDQVMAQNKQNVVQIISIGDESFLKHAKTGHTLHNWADALNHGSHTMLRVGFSDNEGFAYYMEPAAAPNFTEPVPIAWQNFLDGGISGCIAIMPAGVKVPPEGVHFDWTAHEWPAPKPVFDFAKTATTVGGMMQAVDALKAALGNLASDLAALGKEEAAEGEKV
jgi:hypothetical protein